MCGQIRFEKTFRRCGGKGAAHTDPRWVTCTLGARKILCAATLWCLAGCSGGFSNLGPNPTPTAASLNLSSVVAGGSMFNLTVTGTNFVPSSTVQWNGAARATTFGSSTSLQAAIMAADIAAAGTAVVNVVTPSPGGGTSGTLTFTITQPIPIVTISPVAAIVAASAQQQFTANVSNSLNGAVTWEVNGISGGNATVGTVSNAGLFIAPMAELSVTISAVSQADANQSASANLSVLAPHAVGVIASSSPRSLHKLV